MLLPDDLLFQNVSHGSGANGMYVYQYRDASGAGVHMEARRDSRSKPEVRTWRHTAMPGQSFATFDALRTAVLAVTPEQAAVEHARWPQVEIRPEGPALNNRCRLCPREPHIRAMHRVLVRRSWIDQDWDHHAGLCDAHRPLADDVGALTAALDEEVAQRRERAAAKAAQTPPAPRSMT